MIEFNVAAFVNARLSGHNARIGMLYHAQGPNWVELALPWSAELIGDPASGVLASGPIVAMMDMATSMAIWARHGKFMPQATLDLRVDYLRPAVPGRTVIAHGECYRMARSISFVRGHAHDGDPADPLAHVAGTFMTLEGQP